MQITNRYQRVPLDTIVVQRDARQRRVISTDDILDSIRRLGVLNPIILRHEDMVLVAGERRLQASREAGLPDIPVRFVKDLSPVEAQLIELEENVRRADLTWMDYTRAVGRIHQIYEELHPEGWTQKATAEAIGLSPSYLQRLLRVYQDIDSPKIAGAATYMGAWNILARVDERAAGDAISGLITAGKKIFDPKPPTPSQPPLPLGVSQPIRAAPEPPPAPIEPAKSLLQEDFRKWAPAYEGPPFTFLHCDFPYGIGLESIQMHERGIKLGYGDKPEDYWALLDCLCLHLDRLMAYSSHLMFWFSMSHYHTTLEFFRERAPTLAVNPFPLVWLKSDGAGILPDQKRGPRRIYETALLAARGDRNIITPVFNAYAAPTDKSHHPSTKPEPVLKHFFRMFVDEHTTMLDPTCGGGSALRAAEYMGAKHVLGLEIDPEHFAAAESALRQFRVLRKVAG